MNLLLALVTTTMLHAEGWTDDSPGSHSVIRALIVTRAPEPYLEVTFLDENERPVIVRMTVAEAKARAAAGDAAPAKLCQAQLDARDGV